MSDYCEHGYLRSKRCPECRPHVRDRVKRRISRYGRGDLGVAEQSRERSLGAVNMMTGEWTPPPGTPSIDEVSEEIRKAIEAKSWDPVGEWDPRTGRWLQRRRWPWQR